MLDCKAVLDIFASCQAANGFDVFTTITIDEGTGESFGDFCATFKWKGRDFKPRVRYYRDGSGSWVFHT